MTTAYDRKAWIAILETLNSFDLPVDTEELRLAADPEAKLGLTVERHQALIYAMESEGLVSPHLRIKFPGAFQVPCWSITGLGTRFLSDNLVDPNPAPEASLSKSVSPPGAAVVCLDEDELDDWWIGLDVECKADAFIGFSLRAQGQGESHIDCTGPYASTGPRIPVEGSIGEQAAAVGVR